MGASSKPLTFTDAAREFAEKSHRQRREAVADIDFAELAAICDLNYNPKVVGHLADELKKIGTVGFQSLEYAAMLLSDELKRLDLKSADILQALENARRLVHKGRLDEKFTARNLETLRALSKLLRNSGGESDEIYALEYIVDTHEQ